MAFSETVDLRDFVHLKLRGRGGPKLLGFFVSPARFHHGAKDAVAHLRKLSCLGRIEYDATRLRHGPPRRMSEYKINFTP